MGIFDRFSVKEPLLSVEFEARDHSFAFKPVKNTFDQFEVTHPVKALVRQLLSFRERK